MERPPEKPTAGRSYGWQIVIRSFWNGLSMANSQFMRLSSFGIALDNAAAIHTVIGR
jgi:hypothetical protein